MKYNIITIEREYASGGREIGELTAQLLNIPSYGRELLEMTAKRLGTPSEYLEQMEENVSKSLLFSLSTLNSDPFESKESKFQIEESKVIRELASHGNCVIIGRRASAILRERKDVLRVFIYADKQARKKRAVTLYGEDSRYVDSILKKHDKIRANYFQICSGLKWDDRAEYHMLLDSSKLSTNQCAQIIAAAAR